MNFAVPDNLSAVLHVMPCKPDDDLPDAFDDDIAALIDLEGKIIIVPSSKPL